MRMWGVDPENMCRRHLLGEHLEMHMFVGTILKGLSIKGYIDKGLVNPALIKIRHDELAAEMTRRGWNHKTPMLELAMDLPYQPVAVVENMRALKARCEECSKKFLIFKIC